MNAFIAAPGGAVLSILAANVIAFVICVGMSGDAAIPTDVLLQAGAIFSSAFARHEYWRAATYGFLHADPLHLAGNMLALLLWGPHLERRVGFSNFILIYGAALIGGGLVTYQTHAGPFVTVGASGAVSGVLAALFALWVLGESELDASFFLLNFGLNFVLSASAQQIDWRAHFGGFAAGFIGYVLLDLVAKVDAVVLRCKFPEFAKANCLMIFGATAVLLWRPDMADHPAWIVAIAFSAACLAWVKIVDLLLSARKGLAAVVVLTSVANAVLFLWAAKVSIESFCAGPSPTVEAAWRMAEVVCPRPNEAAFVGALGVFAFTLIAYGGALGRGWRDAGFVAAAFKGERKRRSGI